MRKPWVPNSRPVISPKIWPCIHPFFPKYAPVSTPSSYCIGYRGILITGPSYYPKSTLCNVEILKEDKHINKHNSCYNLCIGLVIFEMFAWHIALDEDGLNWHLVGSFISSSIVKCRKGDLKVIFRWWNWIAIARSNCQVIVSTAQELLFQKGDQTSALTIQGKEV